MDMRLDGLPVDDLLSVGHQLADAARPATLRHFRRVGLTADNKAGDHFDPVTAADRECEQAIRAALADLRPQDAVHGEEFADRSGDSGLTWTIDPIDGTRGFLIGAPTWGVLIGLSDVQGPIMGVIDQPFTGERFIGGLGQAAYQGPGGPRALGTRATATLDAAILCSTYPEIGSPTEREAFRDVAGRVKLTRYGMDCYAYALLAMGQLDVVIEAGLHAYDIVAPLAVVTAAGGVVTDWRGGPAHDGGRVVAAANPTLHAAALDILRAAP
ncbi:MAG: inositol monophosphatase family protein [Pseudomonadota bacterium]